MHTTPPATSLPETVLTLWRINALGVGAVLLALVACTGWLWWPEAIPTSVTAVIVMAIVANLALEVGVLLRLRHRAYRYEAAGDFLQLRTGHFLSRRLLVPADQILYVDVQQGPLARRLGLCRVNVGTLGSIHPLGPLEEQRAHEIAEKYGVRQQHYETQ
ncbi:hypothetical protein EII42_03475 [Tessaracoccus sp. OH4464_COT-324]|nr:hypothetical protein EII42_03475 [Tessaracoccus sp. OH4464_COT-324]